MKTQALVLGWYEDFECPGGDCGLTCCTSDWRISLDDDEIEKYKSLNYEYKNEILNAIDLENKCMKMVDGRCALLNKDGFCEKVIHCGPNILSKTCRIFPRNYVRFGEIMEAKVEIVCPIVSEYLLNDTPMDFRISEIECSVLPDVDYNLYDNLADIRTSLIMISQLESGKYINGKIFIIIKVFNDVIDMMKKGEINDSTVKRLLDKYCSETAIPQFFVQCEQIGNRIDAKIPIIYSSLAHLINTGVMKVLTTHFHNRFPYIDEYFKALLDDKELLKGDVVSYIQFMRSNYPRFMEKFLVYSLFSNWIDLNKETFGDLFSCRLLEAFIIQLHGMAIWKYEKENGTLDDSFRKKFAIAIAAVDRPFAHSKELRDELVRYYNTVQNHELVDIFLLTIA